MTITPEFQSALISLAIAGVFVLIAVFKIIPDAIKLALENYEANEQVKREQAKSKSATEAESEHAENQITLAAAALLETQSKTLLSMLDEFKSYREVIATNTSATRSNEKALGDNTEALGDMAERMGILLNVGSTPVQTMYKDIQDIKLHGTPPLIRLEEGFNRMDSAVKDVHTQVMPPGQIITVLTRLETKLDELKAELKAKINEAEKRKTNPIPKIEALPTDGD